MYIRSFSTIRQLESQDGGSKSIIILICVSIVAVLFLCVICGMFYRWRKSANGRESMRDKNAHSKTYTDVHSCFRSPECNSPSIASGSFRKETSEPSKQKASISEDYATYRFANTLHGSHQTDLNGASPCPILGPRLSIIQNSCSSNVIVEKPAYGTEILEMDTIDPHPRLSSSYRLSIKHEIKSQPQSNVVSLKDTSVTTANFIQRDSSTSSVKSSVVYQPNQFKDYIQAKKSNSDTFDVSALEKSGVDFNSSKRNFLVSSQLSARGSNIMYEELCSSRVQTVQVAL
uniref:AlNc14C439G11651 protein n=1 Tax=Albugo laibachii Nc14 TaxID=890382 RepID=F0WZR0_9STRA|nr:AlNc14C439G11651 [Albugo laibachii Nc14]|eukprot:CCA26987.1 AlNc14C439G11651 [Albugo laibachii Nc14]